MRTEAEVDEYKAQAFQRLAAGCPRCGGGDLGCECRTRVEVERLAYEACVPHDFWDVKAEDVTHNKAAFNGPVSQYVSRLGRAIRHGYGLIFLGDNGVGKTMFISYVLMKAIAGGRTAYYTTMPQLDHDIKRGFRDPGAEERLRWMLSSDFLAIDEMGKEQFKGGESGFMKGQVERILKRRFDDSQPVLLATNMELDALVDAYGATVGSILRGKYEPISMDPGDYRAKLAKRMRKDMGYK